MEKRGNGEKDGADNNIIVHTRVCGTERDGANVIKTAVKRFQVHTHTRACASVDPTPNLSIEVRSTGT